MNMTMIGYVVVQQYLNQNTYSSMQWEKKILNFADQKRTFSEAEVDEDNSNWSTISEFT